MAEELKACPWCPLSTRLTTVSYFGTDYYQVLCSCGAHGPRRRTEIGAIESWNRRAPAPEPMIPARIAQIVSTLPSNLSYAAHVIEQLRENPADPDAPKMLAIAARELRWAQSDIEACVNLSLPGDGEIVRSIPPEEGEGKEKDG